MVYISTSALMSSMRANVMGAQSALSTAQAELSSGTHADLGVTLAGQSGTLLSLSAEQDRLQGYSAGNTAASTRLSATDSALTALQSTASTFLSNLTAASSVGTLTSTQQQTASANLAALVAALNTTVGGQAIFGGVNTATAPMTQYAPGSAPKQAVDNAFAANFGTTQDSAAASSITPDQMTSFLSGSFADLFSDTNYPGTWSSASDNAQTTQVTASQTVTTSVSANASAFRGLAQAYAMVTEFTGPTISADTQKAVLARAASVMTVALQALTGTQASVGTAQAAVTAASDRITAQSGVLQVQSSGMTEVDPYALNTKITGLQTQIEASYELTSALQKLSLVNYLGG